jgi:UDP-GlcNAc3NAcA epimerase
MVDALHFAVTKSATNSKILASLNLKPQGYLLATVHRAENTDNKDRLQNIISALNALEEIIVLPIHPRTRNILNDMQCKLQPHLRIIQPVGYFDMIALEKSSRMILTDSGGIQKEAYWLKVPCITLRDETEWVETVENGWNRLTGADSTAIIDAVLNFMPTSEQATLYGDGKAADQTLQKIIKDFERK